MMTLKIPSKLRWLVGVPIVTFVAIGLFSLANTRSMFTRTEKVYGTTEDFRRSTLEIADPLNRLRQLSLSIVMAPDRKLQEQLKGQEDAITRQLDRSFDRWDLDRRDSREELTFRELRASWGRYKTLKDFTIEKALRNYREEAFLNAIDPERRQFDVVTANLLLWMGAKTENARAIYEEARREFHRALWILGLVIALAALAVGGAGLATTRSIVRPLLVLTESATRITRQETSTGDRATPWGETGDLAKVIRRGDEIGQLARTFHRTVEALRAAHDELEGRVRDRTAELDKANAFLQGEIVERKRAEEESHHARELAEDASRAKGEFLANMSHEIRTPMNGVLGMTELTLATDLSPRQREYLGLVKSSADALLVVIDDILDFSKIEAGKLDLDVIPFAPRDVVNDTLRVLARKAHEKGLELACRFGPGVPESIVGDPGRLRQVLMNLVGNAVKFTERGEVVVTVERGSGEDALDLLRFSVADSGIGIPAGKRAAIFNAFEQADGSTTRKYGGTGLGLTISARLVELMHGRIWVEENPGGGSLFRFTARLDCHDGAGAARDRASPVALDGLRVLIVDDNATNRMILEEVLSQWGCRPLAVGSGPEAMQALDRAADRGEPFAMILLDLMMPGMDGCELAGRVGTDRRHAAIRMLMLTSGGPDSSGRFRELGIGGWLDKPVRQSELLDAMLDLIGPLRAPSPPTPPEAIPAPAPAPAAPMGRGLRVLLAEDHPINQKVATRMLEVLGHEVRVAADGRLALEALASSGPFDLVLMDVQMPEMDGFEAIAAIRSGERPGEDHVPVLALTAHAMAGDRERCLVAGFDDYLSKPINAAALAAALARFSADGRAGVAGPEPPPDDGPAGRTLHPSA